MLHVLPARSRPLVAIALSAILAAALAATALGAGRGAGPDPRLADAPLSGPGEWFDAQRAVTGGVSETAYADAIAEGNALGERTREIDPALAGAQWALQGPRNIGGRVVGLAVDPDDPAVLYSAAASGGVWKSTDGGTTFSPAWPTNVTQAMGDIANDSHGTIYAGTGEANPGGGSIVYGGTGVYRTTDGGRTWEHLGLERSGAIGRIAVDPTDDRRIFVAAAGNLFRAGGQRGLYISEDAGRTFELAFEPPNGTTGAVDVTIDPQEPDNVLVAMWDHHRSPDARVYGGPGSGVWRSTDGGGTWDRIEDVTLRGPDADGDGQGDPLPNENGRIGVAFAPSNPDRAYAIIANRLDGTHGAFFRSDDGGATWTQLADDAQLRASQSSYGWWFARIFVDPDDADRLYAAGMELTESTDGGESFLNQTSYLVGVATGAHQVAIHADQHAMVWHPAVPGLVYLGNDGGVYRSAADGTIGTWVAAEVQGWTQHYSVDVSERNPRYTVTGLQDNLCQHNVDADGNVSDFTWTKFGFCGDGLETLLNPDDDTDGWACSQYGGCRRTVAGVPNLLRGIPRQDRHGWFADIEYDPSSSDIVWTHSNYLWRSANGGDSWTQWSDDLSTDPEQLDPNSGYRLRGVATTISPVGNGQSAWVGTDEGLLWHVTAQREATLIDAPDLPGARVRGDGTIAAGAWITKVLVDPADADTVYVAYSGFRSAEEDAQVFRTTDAGASWEDISRDLPSAPVNSLEKAGDALVAATDVGVFLTRDGGERWLRVGGNLPTVPVIDLRWHAPTSQLIAATFGHGIQRVVLPPAPAGDAAGAGRAAVGTVTGAAAGR